MQKTEQAERARAANACLDVAVAAIGQAVGVSGGLLNSKDLARMNAAIEKAQLRTLTAYLRATGGRKL